MFTCLSTRTWGPGFKFCKVLSLRVAASGHYVIDLRAEDHKINPSRPSSLEQKIERFSVAIINPGKITVCEPGLLVLLAAYYVRHLSATRVGLPEVWPYAAEYSWVKV